MASWIDDFEGNKLSSKWVATRNSDGGQYTGVFTREVKDSKLYWNSTSWATETLRYGETIALPVNAPGDITIEALVRQKGVVAYSVLGVGVNKTAGSLSVPSVRYDTGGGALNSVYGIDAAFLIGPLPARPAQGGISNISSDTIGLFKIVRKNGRMFWYGNGFYLKSLAYANTITQVDITATWMAGYIPSEKWVEYIKVSPSSVVL